MERIDALTLFVVILIGACLLHLQWKVRGLELEMEQRIRNIDIAVDRLNSDPKGKSYPRGRIGESWFTYDAVSGTWKEVGGTNIVVPVPKQKPSRPQ